MCAFTIVIWRRTSFIKMLKTSFLLVLLTASTVHSNATSTCGKKEMCDSYLDLAIDMIVRAKHNIPICPKTHIISKNTQDGTQPVDCADILQMGYNKSGIYEIWPNNRLTEGRPLRVYCDMDTNEGGWTVIQRRGDFGSPKNYFFQNWDSYKEGFGELEKDFWLGNDNIFALTNQKLYSARFDLMDVDQNKTFANYEKFWIDDESNKYTLHIFFYSGDAGDSMTDYHNNGMFTTKDQDNDRSDVNCAVTFGGGWWYNDCHKSNLNGLYLKGKHDSYADGVNWHEWKGYHESLEWVEIKVRPKTFIRPSFSLQANLS